MATPKIIADFETIITSKIDVGTTSFTINSVTDDDGITVPDGLYEFTLDSGSSNKQYVEGTLTASTKTVADVKNVSRQGAITTGSIKEHRVGTSIKITDFATYKKYMDETSIAGASNATQSLQGLVELPTQAEVDAGTSTGGTGAGLAVTPDMIRAKKYNDYVADAGANDSYSITVVPAISGYVVGQEFTFKANTANTGACTLNVNALGAKTIKKSVSIDLQTGDILTGQIVKVVYDASGNMQLVSVKSVSTPTIQVFTSSGTYTKPAGLAYAKVRGVGGGGGSAGAVGTGAPVPSASGGAGGGGYFEKTIVASSIGATETVTIGAAGIAGTSSPGNGGDGGTTSFGSHASATGGKGSPANSSTTDSSYGGVGSGGDINIVGGAGQAINSTTYNGTSAGAGGSSMLGGGGKGGTTNTSSSTSTGQNYGGGAGGVYSPSSASPQAGNAGKAGVIIVEEFYN